jgi:hypothetical protein
MAERLGKHLRGHTHLRNRSRSGDEQPAGRTPKTGSDETGDATITVLYVRNRGAGECNGEAAEPGSLGAHEGRVAAPWTGRLGLLLGRHGLHLENDLSAYFARNRHLLGEALALHALMTLFPGFSRAGRCRAVRSRQSGLPEYELHS